MAFDPVRDLMRAHILETTPVGPGAEVLGRPVERRILHSVHSASLETGAHPKRLRKLLAAAGLLSAGHEAEPNDRVLFGAEPARRVLEAVVDGLREFLVPPSVAACRSETFDKTWPKGGPWR